MRFLKARKMSANDAFELYENYYRFMQRNGQLYDDSYSIHDTEVGTAKVNEIRIKIESRSAWYTDAYRLMSTF